MKHDVDFYLERGFDERTARYFASGRRKAVEVSPIPRKSLLVTFDNGEQRVYEVGSIIVPGTVFAFLSDDAAFERVYIDENHDVAWDIDPFVDSKAVWSNKVDISADTCYLDGVEPENAAG